MTSSDQQDNPRLTLKLLVHMDVRQPMTIPRHQHCDYEFIYLRAGTYEYQHNSFHSRIAPGQGFLIRPGDWHVDILPPDTNYVAVNFILQDNADNLLREGLPEPLLQINDPDLTVARLLDKMEEENHNPDAFSPLLKETLLQELYWQILRRLPREAVAATFFNDADSKKFLRDLRRAALRNIQRPATLPELAEQLHLSPRTLNNRCRSCLKMSPLKAIAKFRMELALELLTHTAMSVKEVSDYLGFQNPYHFSKVFKRILSVPPSACRPKTPRQP